MSNVETEESLIVYFKLPEYLDNMSPAEFKSYMADKDENHILELAEEITQGEMESRWCTEVKYIGEHCSGSCPYGSLRGKVKFYRQYCDHNGWRWWSVDQNQCCW